MKQRIEKTLVILDEAEARQLLLMAKRKDRQEIQQYMMKIFIKKVEAILRRKCK